MSNTATLTGAGGGMDSSHKHAVTPNEIAVGVIIGRVGEFFDFFVYGIASVLVFPALFFPFATPLDGLIYSLIIFGFGFVARPIGAILFRLIHDRYSRTAKLTSALFLLGTATVTIAFLPGYEEIGVTAIFCLFGLRIAQGLAVGGAWDGLPSLLALTAPPERRGWYAMIAQIGAPIGFFVATGLFAYLVRHVPADEFIAWGWQFAFFTAFAINVVTLFARLRMSVAPEYEELFKAKELIPSPMAELARTQSMNILSGALTPLASYALFNVVTIFPLAWVVLSPDKFSLNNLLMLQMAGAVLCLLSMLISGKVADRIGRDKTLYWGAVMIALFTLPAPILGETKFGAYAFILIGFALLGFSLAQAAGAVNNSFDMKYRYSGALISHELGWLLGAGFAPIAALLLAVQFGNAGVALYLLSGAVVTLTVLKLNFKRVQASEQD